jgi:hypothetical protein
MARRPRAHGCQGRDPPTRISRAARRSPVPATINNTPAPSIRRPGWIPASRQARHPRSRRPRAARPGRAADFRSSRDAIVPQGCLRAEPTFKLPPFEDGEELWLPVAEVRRHHPDFEPIHAGSVVAGKLAGRVAGDIAPGVPRTWNVDVAGLTDGAGIQRSIPVSARRFRRHAKILIIRIGERETEQTTPNPPCIIVEGATGALASAQ